MHRYDYCSMIGWFLHVLKALRGTHYRAGHWRGGQNAAILVGELALPMGAARGLAGGVSMSNGVIQNMG